MKSSSKIFLVKERRLRIKKDNTIKSLRKIKEGLAINVTHIALSCSNISAMVEGSSPFL
jgi:hypothetical protein